MMRSHLPRTAPLAALVVCLVLTPARAEPPDILVLPLGVGGVEAASARRLDQLLTVEIAKATGKRVVSIADLEAMLGLERARDELGCTEVTCYTELAKTLSAPRVISGYVSRVEDTLFFVLNLYDATSLTVLRRAAVELRWTEDNLVPGARAAVAKLFPPTSALDAPIEWPSVSQYARELLAQEVVCRSFDTCAATYEAYMERIERLVRRDYAKLSDGERLALQGRLQTLGTQLRAHRAEATHRAEAAKEERRRALRAESLRLRDEIDALRAQLHANRDANAAHHKSLLARIATLEYQRQAVAAELRELQGPRL